MNSISKFGEHFEKRHRLHFEKVSVKSPKDRISNLPRCLIGHILSFLPTKDAVATSVLSTKWKYLWTSITNLDFDDELVVVSTDYSTSNKEKQSLVEMSFINFVYRVLSRNVLDLQKFRLRCLRRYDVSHLSAWVSIALSRNLRELHLSHIRSLPRELFTCTSLVVLRLEGSFILNVPSLISLPRLKILIIDSLEFLDDHSIYWLISSCPTLEDLAIKKCNLRNISVLNISSPVLKSLTLVSSHYNHKIELNTPKLRELECNGYLAKSYSVDKLHALVKANIRVVRNFYVEYVEEHAVAGFVEYISKVKWLHLSVSSLETFDSFGFVLPKFNLLTYLELDTDAFGGWELLLNFFEISPHLRTLILLGLPQDDEEEIHTTTCRWNTTHQMPSCLLYQLKKIEIRGFEGDYNELNELKMVEYFLENSRVLEKLIISFSHGAESLGICKKILMLPRGSKTCRVEIL